MRWERWFLYSSDWTRVGQPGLGGDCKGQWSASFCYVWIRLTSGQFAGWQQISDIVLKAPRLTVEIGRYWMLRFRFHSENVRKDLSTIDKKFTFTHIIYVYTHVYISLKLKYVLFLFHLNHGQNFNFFSVE